MTKPRIMIMSDHSALHTGFANVSRHILNYLYDTGKYEIAEFGWFAPHPSEVKDRLPRWKCYITDRTSPVMADQDRYGMFTLKNAIVDFKPDVLLSIGDEWMVNHVGALKNEYGFYWCSYVPIDGMPIPPEWLATFEAMDTCVAYGEWGAKVMRQRKPTFDPVHIFHGVETDVFKPDENARRKTRKIMGLTDDDFLVGFVGRNQPRKQIPSLFNAFALWSKPHNTCKETGKPWITDQAEWYINEITYPMEEIPFAKQSRLNPMISPFTGKYGEFVPDPGKPNAKLYLHCAYEDVGWNIQEQFSRYRLHGKVISVQNLKIGCGVSDEELNGIYNSFDVFTLPTIGEGFGLPILEAMSCGIPICVTNWSAHTEWCSKAGMLIKPAALITEPLTNIIRAYVSIPDYVNKLEILYKNKELRTKYGKNGREKALTMDWQKNILPLWEEVVDHAVEVSNGKDKYVAKVNNNMQMEIC